MAASLGLGVLTPMRELAHRNLSTMSGDFGNQQFQRQQFKHKPKDMAKANIDHESIRQELSTPAKGLLYSGILSVILVIGATVGSLVYGATQTKSIVRNLVWNMYGIDTDADTTGGNRFKRSKAEKELEASREKQANTMMTLAIGVIIILGISMCAVYFFAISGGILMGQLSNYKVCRLACILALIPVVSPLIVVGIPFGLMGLAKLKKPEVKRAFN